MDAMKRSHAIIVCLFLIAGCGAEQLDAGSNDPPQGVKWSSTPPTNSFGCIPGDPACHGTPCVGEVPEELAGIWEGEMTDHTSASGSSSIRIEFKGRGWEGDTGLCGTVTFGGATPPPFPHDPEAWPPGVPTDKDDVPRVPIEGFTYEFWTHGLPDPRLLVPLFGYQPLKAWCEMQLSYPAAILFQDAFTCLPPAKGIYTDLANQDCALFADGVGGERTPVSCAKVVLCNDGCECDSSGCTIRRDVRGSQPDMQCDLVITGDTASGRVAAEDGVHEFTLTHVR
jgi:hypothetical protein